MTMNENSTDEQKARHAAFAADFGKCAALADAITQLRPDLEPSTVRLLGSFCSHPELLIGAEQSLARGLRELVANLALQGVAELDKQDLKLAADALRSGDSELAIELGVLVARRYCGSTDDISEPVRIELAHAAFREIVGAASVLPA